MLTTLHSGFRDRRTVARTSTPCAHGTPAETRLIAYDLLALDGEDLRKLPLRERRKRLEDLLSGNDALWFSCSVDAAEGAALFRHAYAMGLEGIVSKRIDTPYRSGPFLGWRKIKCPGYVRP